MQNLAIWGLIHPRASKIYIFQARVAKLQIWGFKMLIFYKNA